MVTAIPPGGPYLKPPKNEKTFKIGEIEWEESTP
jgi:hypothetical protein